MDNIAFAACVSDTPHHTSLPDDRSEWPEQARKAFHDVVGQLDRWCRRYYWPTTGNARVAEEAIRQSW